MELRADQDSLLRQATREANGNIICLEKRGTGSHCTCKYSKNSQHEPMLLCKGGESHSRKIKDTLKRTLSCHYAVGIRK